jgi:hypothetical protein
MRFTTCMIQADGGTEDNLLILTPSASSSASFLRPSFRGTTLSPFRSIHPTASPSDCFYIFFNYY